MRQLTLLESESAARRLAAFLVTERIAAHVDTEKEGYSVWVRDEDQLAKAREILDHFRQHPADPRYHGVEQSAETIRREAERRRREKMSNVVATRGRWGSGGIKTRCPAVIAMIVACVLVAVATNMGQSYTSLLLTS